MAKVQIGNSSIEVNSDKAALEFQKAEHNFQLDLEREKNKFQLALKDKESKLQLTKWRIIFATVLLIVFCAIAVPDMRKYIAEGVGSVAVGKLGFGVYGKIAGKVKK